MGLVRGERRFRLGVKARRMRSMLLVARLGAAVLSLSNREEIGKCKLL